MLTMGLATYSTKTVASYNALESLSFRNSGNIYPSVIANYISNTQYIAQIQLS